MSPLISIWLFNLALIAGMIVSQVLDLESSRTWLFFLTDTLLAYIMIEVGLEFLIQKKKWKNYLLDYGVASLAAGLPWLFCFLYFLKFGSESWQENLLLARFAAPTATGILFTMLGLAGLGMTWLFRKVEVLVILDDLDTIILLIPIQFLLSGGRLELVFVAFLMVIFVVLGWRYMHVLKLPTSRPWLFCYAVLIGGITEWLDLSFGLEIEVLLPAFICGLMLYQAPEKRKALHRHEHEFIEPRNRIGILVERAIKFLFMFLVGLLLPDISFSTDTLKNLGFHIIGITILMNIGKLAPIFFYKKEATLRERIAVSISMMPRGEVGAGILSIALGHGIKGLMVQAAAISLAFNMFLTGFFIWLVMWLLKDKRVKN